MIAIGRLLRVIEYTAKGVVVFGDDENASDVVLRVQPTRGVRPRRMGGSPDDRLRVDAAGAVAGHGGGARARQVRSDHARGQPRGAGDLPGTDGRLSTLRRARALSRSGPP